MSERDGPFEINATTGKEKPHRGEWRGLEFRPGGLGLDARLLPFIWNAGQQIKASLAPDRTVAACAKLIAAKDGIVTTSDEVFASCDRQDEILKWALGRTLERATLQLVAITAAACAVVAVLVVAISGR